MAREIPISKGYVAIVDDADYPLLSSIRWFAKIKSNTVYAYHRGRHGKFSMHRKILNPPSGLEVDHRNRNGLDNRRENLRACTHSENMLNSKSFTSQRGITFDKCHNRWKARILRDGKRVSLGSFLNETDASNAYRKAVEEN